MHADIPRRRFLALGAAAAIVAKPGRAADLDASRVAKFNGLRIHYENYGAGPEALVFIHGWACDLTFWRGQEALYANYHSLLIDLPGHGLSD